MPNAHFDTFLRRHTAVLGMTGSGKTSTAKLLVEHVVAQGARVCVLDPIKSDWWGLISSADGKKPGLPFNILGGPHGHTPLHSSAGKAIGELVASGALPLSIIDMVDFEAGGLQRFFTEFSEALLRKMKGVLYLVIEEAHEFAPKERSGIGNENMAIHWAKKLATAGRSKGIRLIVATQRTQSLHNALLGSCPTMIAHQLTAPADQEPVLKFLKANVKKEERQPIEDSLSSLDVGEGWICSAAGGLIERVKFPRITTYDNSATPEDDSHSESVVSAKVDRDKLMSVIGEAVKEAVANDPATLKAEIAKLRQQVAAKPSVAATSKPDEASLNRAYMRGKNAGYSEGVVDGWNAAAAQITEKLEGLKLGPVPDSNIQGHMKKAAKSVDHEPARVPVIPASPTRPEKGMPTPAKLSDATTPAHGLTNPQVTLMRALAWWKQMGHEQPTRTQVAAIAGWKPKGSNLRNRLTELSGMGLVTYPDAGRVRMTEEGAALGLAPEFFGTMIDSIRATLTNPQLQVFDQLLSYGHGVSRDDLAIAIGWQPQGSNLRNRLTELSQLELVEYPTRGTVRLQEWVR